MTYLAHTIIGALTPDIGPEYCFLGATVRGLDHVSYEHEIGGTITIRSVLFPGIVAHRTIGNMVIFTIGIPIKHNYEDN